MRKIEIKQKGVIGQLFCRHKNTGWFKKSDGRPFPSISGERHYQICKDCGKEIGSHYAKYEGMGFK